MLASSGLMSRSEASIQLKKDLCMIDERELEKERGIE
jgi:hypothetical protein